METSFLPLITLFSLATQRTSFEPWKAAGLLLWACQLAMVTYKAGLVLGGLALFWGVVKYVQEHMNNSLGSIDSSRIRCVTWTMAAGVGIVLSALRFPSVSLLVPDSPSTMSLPATVLLYLLGTALLTVLPEQVAIPTEAETLRVVGGLAGITVGFVVTRFDLLFYGSLSVLSFAMTACLTYESEEGELPLTAKTQSILSHILSHKDSRNLAAFFW